MIGEKLSVLFAASECVPLCKTGGLADVVGALPEALSDADVDVKVILPFYKTLPKEVLKKATLVKEFDIEMEWRTQYIGLKTLEYKSRTYYFIDNQFYFNRDNLYGYYDDCERYLFFSLAVLECLKYIEAIDIIHCNDWQTALIPTMLKNRYSYIEGYEKYKTVFTIHNLRFQGQMGFTDLLAMLHIKHNETWLWQFYHNFQGNFLKSALYNADMITTVSPTYAEEIKHAYYAEGMQDYISDIEYKLRGILNGIDVNTFDPRKDKNIYINYGGTKNKEKNKKSFREEFNLQDNDSMVIGMVTRLDAQKGLDLVIYAIERIMQLDVQLVILGTGDEAFEGSFHEIEEKYNGKARCFIMYDEKLAHKIYAASDVFLMPSRFEPCGLGQLIAMRYGSLPIVRETGGLADTVVPYNEITGEGTGFSFANYNGDELFSIVNMAYDVFKNNRDAFNRMVRRAFRKDFSWMSSALEYKKIYEEIIE